jgi:RHS repeat-associated protein
VLHQLGTTTLDGESYTYDLAGNRKTRTDKRLGTTLTYAYDNIYQLLTAKQGTTTKESYTHDLVGNRLSSLGVNPYSYNSSNELTSIPGTTYAYDNNGNLQTKTTSAGTTTYAWDYENRLTQVALPGTGGTVTYKYDPFGRRVQKAFTQGGSTTTTNYLYDGDNLIEEVGQNANVLARYTQGPGIDQPLSELRSGTTSFYQQDGLSSVTSLSSNAGALANTYAYDAYGKLTTSTGSMTNPLQYTGREFDSETGLFYNRYRFCEPSVGRFVSEDPAGFEGGTNFYAYAGGNPVVFNDPMGLNPTGLTPSLSPWTAAEEAAYQAFAEGLQGTSNLFPVWQVRELRSYILLTPAPETILDGRSLRRPSSSRKVERYLNRDARNVDVLAPVERMQMTLCLETLSRECLDSRSARRQLQTVQRAARKLNE